MSSSKDKDPYHLQRFVEAQQDTYTRALSELRNGKKRSHWMWYIFPQIEGLGHSSTAHFYSIKSRGEAEAYLAHPVLGERLLECTSTLVNLDGLTASGIFGYPDDLKLCSCMTLFEQVAQNNPLFSDALTKYFDGKRDVATLEKL